MSVLFAAAAAAALTVDPIVDQFLKYQLIDYDSAKIEVILPPRDKPVQADGRNPTKKKPATATSVVHCLRINSKNRLGGYIGWRRYYFEVFGGKVIWYQDERTNSYEVERECPVSN